MAAATIFSIGGFCICIPVPIPGTLSHNLPEIQSGIASIHQKYLRFNHVRHRFRERYRYAGNSLSLGGSAQQQTRQGAPKGDGLINQIR
jgi:hypothetical protein